MNHESYEDEALYDFECKNDCENDGDCNGGCMGREPTADCCAECGTLLSSSWQLQNPGIQVCEGCFYGGEAV